MISDFTNPVTQLVQFSLDVLDMQHSYIANNIANANTPGYYPSRINFSSIYNEINNNMNTEQELSSLLLDVKVDVQNGEHIISSNVAGVELDSELIGLSKNTVMYRALLSALSNRADFMKIVLNSGNGK